MVRIILSMALAGGALLLGAAANAQLRTMTSEDISTRIWAKVAHERAKAGAIRSGLVVDDQLRGCGNLEIGNVDTGGARRGAPREVNTVVLGDVINVAGRCK
jgi:hypothetical protein